MNEIDNMIKLRDNFPFGKIDNTTNRSINIIRSLMISVERQLCLIIYGHFYNFS